MIDVLVHATMRAVEFGNLTACEGLCEHPKTEKDKVVPRKMEEEHHRE